MDSQGERESILLNKYFVLILTGFAILGQNFLVDNPAALEDILVETLHLTDFQYSSLYSLYSWPNTVLCLCNGYIIDKVLGARLSIILFTLIMTVGQVIFAGGAYFHSVILMQSGRFIFGFGGESIYVAVFKLISRWFMGTKQLNMAISFLYCTPNLGSVLNMYVMPLIYDSLNEHTMRHFPSNQCVAVTLLASACVSVFSFICSLFLFVVDRRKYRNDKSFEGKDVNSSLKLSDVASFPFQFWLIAIIGVTYFAVIYPYIGNIKLFYMFKYELSAYFANVGNSLINILAAILSPIVGLIVDHTGYNISWLFFGVVFTIGTHVLLAFTYISPFIISTLIGVWFSVISSALFPTVPLILSEDRLGTAYGFMQSLENLGTALTGTAVGYIVDSCGYFFLDLVWINYLGICLSAIIVLYVYDNLKGGKINKSVSERNLPGTSIN